MRDLSPQTEQYLANVVADGLFPSKEAAIEAAVEALREKTEEIPMVPPEHMALVEEAIEQSNAGLSKPMSPADWEHLRQIARDAANRSRTSGS